jgi:hypothetical protein
VCGCQKHEVADKQVKNTQWVDFAKSPYAKKLQALGHTETPFDDLPEEALAIRDTWEQLSAYFTNKVIPAAKRNHGQHMNYSSAETYLNSLMRQAADRFMARAM